MTETVSDAVCLYQPKLQRCLEEIALDVGAVDTSEVLPALQSRPLTALFAGLRQALSVWTHLLIINCQDRPHACSRFLDREI